MARTKKAHGPAKSKTRKTTLAAKRSPRRRTAKTIKVASTEFDKVAAPMLEAVGEAVAQAVSGVTCDPTHDEIAIRAYEKWLQRGCDLGHESEDWLAAEEELTQDIRRAA